MSAFVDVASSDVIAPGTAIVATVAGNPVALFNVGGRVFAIEGCCARCGASLAAGKVQGTEVTCSGCDWQYDVTSGCVCRLPALQIDTFEAKVVDSRILVRSPVTPAPRVR